jgi:hypothetical protein
MSYKRRVPIIEEIILTVIDVACIWAIVSGLFYVYLYW